jgi:tetratricopeptide (TPR) repeat protein
VMIGSVRIDRKRIALGVALVVAAVSVEAQAGRQTGAPDSLVQQVRVALGRGQVTQARQLSETGSGPAGSRELASALVDIFEGKETEARAKLEPLARRAPLGDAAVELGLLEIRRGRRDEGWKILDPIAANRVFNGQEDYYRLTRAARGTREFLLANDGFQQLANVARADIHTDWGDLFLERHQAADALDSYSKAIELDPSWVPAHVGAARALAELPDAKSEEAAAPALERARKLAPDHPAVLRLTAERAIETEEFAAAAQALDRLAKVRPESVEEAALRVPLAYEAGGAAAVETAIGRIREIDPRSALGYRAAGEQAARRYRFDEAAAFARQATALDADDPQAHFDLGLYLMRTGDEKAARTALERSWDLDKSARVTKNLLDVLDKIDAFEVVTSGDFIFKFAKEEAAVLKTYAVPLAAEAYKTFTTRYGFTPSGPILVEVFPMHDDFAVRTLGLPGLVGALGACFGRVVSMDSPRARPPGEFSWQATLWHEIAHVYTLQLSKYRVPRWLTEGISVFEEHRKQPAWGRELTLEFARQLSQGKTFGVKNLPDAFKRPESLAFAYFEASLVVEHLVELNGDQGLRTLLLAYADGAKDADAFSKAFGRSVDAVEASFKTFVDQRYGALSRAMANPPSQVRPDDLAGLKARASEASGNYVSQLQLGMALLKGRDLDGARGALERAAKLAPQATGDASPHALLAQVAEQQGDRPRAVRELRQLLTHNHENVRAARSLVALATETKSVEDQDFGLRAVADLDPFDAEVHGQLGRRLMEKNDLAGAVVEFQAALAMGPANLAESHTDLGEALLKTGRRDDARAQAVLALKQAPTYARALDLLLAAIGRELP